MHLHESVLRSAAEKARLAARLNIQVDATGRRLAGELDPRFDALHRRITELEDQLLDQGLPLSSCQVEWFYEATTLLESIQPVLRLARRELEHAA